MKNIKDTELILTKEKKIYHLKLEKKQIADNIILVGDQERVGEISKYFDKIYYKIKNREFTTHTGIYKKKKISVISTGIGCDNIDIVVNELDALVNINFEQKTINKNKKSLNLIRIGTSGSIQSNIKINTSLVTEYAIGFDGLAHFYEKKECIDNNLTNEFIKYSNWPKEHANPYSIKASENLLNKFNHIQKGITVTASGFYGPQDRKLRLKQSNIGMTQLLSKFKYNDLNICNFEMESSALYFLGQSLGHNTITICAILGNRINQSQSNKYSETINILIKDVLENI
tara:strand:+ start:8910 stop:9770 length:861 start_codon:yes stop_codon:yes gene_type:complete